jgi:allophanate hydrolase subunit 2
MVSSMAQGLAASAVANEMIAEEANNARIEVAMKGSSVEARGIGTKKQPPSSTTPLMV